MGWFLSAGNKKKKGARKKAARKSAASRVQWDPQKTRHVAKYVTVVVLLLAGAVIWRYGETALIEYAGRQHARSVQAEDVELAAVPGWIPRPDRERIRAFVAERVGEHPMDGISLRVVAGELARGEAWIREVEQVRRLQGGAVRVRARYREPVAVVQGRDGYHMVDREAVKVGGLYFEHQLEHLDLPVILGARSAPPARAGQAWPGREVAAGLELIGFLRGEAYLGQVRAVDVSRQDERGRRKLVLRTRSGGQVLWGLPVGREQAVEPEASVKRAWLRTVHAEHGSIDAGGQVVDAAWGATVHMRREKAGDDPEGANAYTLGR